MELTRKPNDIACMIHAAQRIALCSHVNPDGDTVGSVLALKLGLEKLGKQVSVFCQDKIPDKLGMLAGVDAFQAETEERFDLLINVDISEFARMGKCSQLLAQADHVAQIDHHGTNPCEAEVNSVDPAAPATGVLMIEQLDALGVTIDRDMAKCLYAAISTDTGNFAFDSTNAETFTAMSRLMDSGLPLGEMNRMLFRLRERQHVKLLGRALNSLTFHGDGSVTSMRLTWQDFQECDALPEHADAIVNYALEMGGVRMAVLGRENGDGSIKMAVRAVSPDRVDGIARSFGGGGHAQASGCTLEGPLDQAMDAVLNAMINLH